MMIRSSSRFARAGRRNSLVGCGSRGCGPGFLFLTNTFHAKDAAVVACSRGRGRPRPHGSWQRGLLREFGAPEEVVVAAGAELEVAHAAGVDDHVVEIPHVDVG